MAIPLLEMMRVVDYAVFFMHLKFCFRDTKDATALTSTCRLDCEKENSFA